MRIVRRIVALVIGIVIAIVCASSSAIANEAIAGIEDASGNDCNPCAFHMDGESHLARLDTGAIISRCADEFFVRLYGNGTGEIEWVGASDHFVTPCGYENCAVMFRHWSMAGAEEIASEQVEFPAGICLRNRVTLVERECTLDIVAIDVGGGNYHFDVVTPCPQMGLRYEYAGSIEDHDVNQEGLGINVHHL